MIPHKSVRGQTSLERFKAYEGIPPPYDKVKRAVVPDALKCAPASLPTPPPSLFLRIDFFSWALAIF